jgi:hypothetical protein
MNDAAAGARSASGIHNFRSVDHRKHSRHRGMVSRCPRSSSCHATLTFTITKLNLSHVVSAARATRGNYASAIKYFVIFHSFHAGNRFYAVS